MAYREAKRQRVTLSQKDLLITLVEQSRDELSRLSGTRFTEERRRWWHAAAEQLNSLEGAKRSGDMWHKCFKDLVTSAKLRGSDESKFQGGPGYWRPGTDVNDLRLLNLCCGLEPSVPGNEEVPDPMTSSDFLSSQSSQTRTLDEYPSFSAQPSPPNFPAVVMAPAGGEQPPTATSSHPYPQHEQPPLSDPPDPSGDDQPSFSFNAQPTTGQGAQKPPRVRKRRRFYNDSPDDEMLQRTLAAMEVQTASFARIAAVVETSLPRIAAALENLVAAQRANAHRN